MFHANAWGVPYTAAMLGVKMVLPGPHLHPDDLLPLLQSERVTISCGVPTIWLAMEQVIAVNPEKWKLQPGLRLTVGGSAVPETLIRAYAKFGVEILQGWGMTETSPLATVSKPTGLQGDLDEDARFKVRAMQGYPLPLVDVRAIGANKRPPLGGRSYLTCNTSHKAHSHPFPDTQNRRSRFSEIPRSRQSRAQQACRSAAPR